VAGKEVEQEMKKWTKFRMKSLADWLRRLDIIVRVLYWNGPANLLKHVFLYCLNLFSRISASDQPLSVTYMGDEKLISSGQF
jgi:hypothetical protein